MQRNDKTKGRSLCQSKGHSNMLVPVLLFILGLVMLIKGGDWFVDGAVAVAHRFHLPELLIGATIVSIGTTLPEVMVSTMSYILVTEPTASLSVRP